MSMTDWKSVPIRPTPEMLDAIRNQHWRDSGCQFAREDYLSAYRVMLDAAPEPPAGDPDADAYLRIVDALKDATGLDWSLDTILKFIAGLRRPAESAH
jgi:hypothetical protein